MVQTTAAQMQAIPLNKSTTTPLVYECTDARTNLDIQIAGGVHAQIITYVKGEEHNLILTIGNNAVVDIVCIQDAKSDATVRISQKSIVAAGATVHWHNVTLGGNDVEHDLVSHLTGESATSNIDWMFYGKENEKQHLSARNVFDAPNGGGEITIQGVAEDKAYTTFDGCIEITQNGKGTDTYLTETTLMLDPTAKVNAIPGLEIKTHDVKASHSATVTKVSKEDLFYFASRGITESDARKMYILGFLSSLCDAFRQSDLRTTVRTDIAKKYDC